MEIHTHTHQKKKKKTWVSSQNTEPFEVLGVTFKF